MRSWRWTTLALVIAIGAAPAANAIQAQLPVPARTAPSWRVARDPFVDLWYHCLALVGYEGYGPLSLYDRSDAAGARAAKRRAGLATTLDARGAELAAAFARDSAFEILHFVPVYFLGRDPRVALTELRQAVESPVASPNAPAGLIAAALATPRERAVLLSFIDAAEEEWASHYRDAWTDRSEADRRAVQELQATWADRFAQPLAGYLGATTLMHGVIIVSPAVGSDGRFVRDAAGMAIVVVSSTRTDLTDAPLLAAVRELTYPLLDRLRTPLTAPTTRVAAARARDAAAVRAGALLLDATEQRLAAEYRHHFLQLTTGRSFDSAYPIDRDAEAELRALIAATLTNVAARTSSYENP